MMPTILGGRLTDAIIDSGRVPDPLLRIAIRSMLRRRLAALQEGGVGAAQDRKRQLLEDLARAPVTIHAREANDQHYEVPAEFFQRMLGAHLKYSCGYWSSPGTTLDEAEQRMLELTCSRAELVDGQDVLELGCGWGSLTLWMAQQYPSSRITAVSNSASQRDHILQEAKQRGLGNIDVITVDVAELSVAASAWDRVVSVEMFEHVRNHAALFGLIAQWLRPGGKLFVHVFAHRQWPYLFEPASDRRSGGDWMSRHFFTGGMMPSDDLFVALCGPLQVQDHWIVSGTHYARTCQAWVDRLDANPSQVEAILAEVHGRDRASAWRHRWRVFDLACQELFAFRDGNEWFVSHYLFVRA